MKNILILAISFVAIFTLIQCQKDTITPGELEITIKTGDTIAVSGSIDQDVTWETGNIYLLNGQVDVTNNATLTIQPGVLVKGVTGTHATLVITNGSKINANGTASNPIIFTAEEDDLEPGQIVSPNGLLPGTGLWGGLIILGKAPISDISGQAAVKCQFVPDDAPAYYFGGNESNDNSGTLNYVSIRYAGDMLVPDESIPALSLQGVGNGTTINHLEIYAAGDDALAIRGGTVNLSNLACVRTGDDNVDFDLGWNGTLNNLIVKNTGDHDYTFEIDGGKGQDNPSFTIKNVSCMGNPNGEGGYVEIRRNAKFKLENAYFFNYGENAEVALLRSENAANWLDSSIDVVKLEFNTSHLSSGNRDIATIFADKTGSGVFSTRLPDAAIVTARSVGADKSEFTSWTAADGAGDLSGF